MALIYAYVQTAISVRLQEDEQKGDRYRDNTDRSTHGPVQKRSTTRRARGEALHPFRKNLTKGCTLIIGGVGRCATPDVPIIGTMNFGFPRMGNGRANQIDIGCWLDPAVAGQAARQRKGSDRQ